MYEAQSSVNLLRDSIEAIRDLREPMLHGDAVFTLGSIGVEKAMKILLGCAEVEHSGRWPTVETLKSWGHDVESLSDRLVATAKNGLPQATANGYAETLIERIESSTTMPLLFATFSRYGRSGRFHYLDILATDQPGSFDSPLDYWRRVENHIHDIEPSLLQGPIPDSQAELDAILAAMADIIASELDVWWFAVHRLAVQGCFGVLGKKIGWALWDPERPAPPQIEPGRP